MQKLQRVYRCVPCCTFFGALRLNLVDALADVLRLQVLSKVPNYPKIKKDILDKARLFIRA
jgi:hypothetical protein